MGCESTLRRAREVVYWPNMAEDIQRVTQSSIVIQALKQQFALYGVPLVVHLDEGPQLTSEEFRDFSKSWGFSHTVSSYHSQSNGKAESVIKIAKRLFKRSPDHYMALLEYRNTPTVGLGSSPAQHLLARRTRSVFPVRDTQLHYAPQDQMWVKKVHRQQTIRSNLSAKGRDLPLLRVGQPVLLQDVHVKKTEWRRGLCQGQMSNRSYVVEVDGQPMHCNMRFLKPNKVVPNPHEGTEGEIKTPEMEVQRP